MLNRNRNFYHWWKSRNIEELEGIFNIFNWMPEVPEIPEAAEKLVDTYQPFNTVINEIEYSINCVKEDYDR